MPMIETRYCRGKISDSDAAAICGRLEDALRQYIKEIRPNVEGYKITVEGDPFGPIALNQPDFRIYIFYHEEWNFSKTELAQLARAMRQKVKELLQEQGLPDITAKIRFYLRPGHAAASIP